MARKEMKGKENKTYALDSLGLNIAWQTNEWAVNGKHLSSSIFYASARPAVTPPPTTTTKNNVVRLPVTSILHNSFPRVSYLPRNVQEEIRACRNGSHLSEVFRANFDPRTFLGIRFVFSFPKVDLKISNWTSQGSTGSAETKPPPSNHSGGKEQETYVGSGAEYTLRSLSAPSTPLQSSGSLRAS